MPTYGRKNMYLHAVARVARAAVPTYSSKSGSTYMQLQEEQ